MFNEREERAKQYIDTIAELSAALACCWYAFEELGPEQKVAKEIEHALEAMRGLSSILTELKMLRLPHMLGR